MCSFAQFFFEQFFLSEDALICGFVFWAISSATQGRDYPRAVGISHEGFKSDLRLRTGLAAALFVHL